MEDTTILQTIMQVHVDADTNECTELKEPPVKTDAQDAHCTVYSCQCYVFWFLRISKFVKCYISQLKESMMPFWAGNLVTRRKLCLWF